MTATLASLAPCRMGSTVIPIDSVGFAPGVIEQLSHHSGQEYPTLHVVTGGDPTITVSGPFMPLFNALGFGVTRLTTFDVYLSKFSALIKSAASDHLKYALNTSCAAAAQIAGASVDQDGILTATAEIKLVSQLGTGDPFVLTTNNALPTLAAQPTLHTLGPVSINGTVYPGLQSSGIDLSPTLQTLRADGAKFSAAMARTQAQPSLSLTHADPYAIETLLGLLGLNISANVVAYFREISTAGVITGGATDCSITIASGRVTPEDASASQGGIATKGMKVSALSATSTAPMAVSFTATTPALP